MGLLSNFFFGTDDRRKQALGILGKAGGGFTGSQVHNAMQNGGPLANQGSGLLGGEDPRIAAAKLYAMPGNAFDSLAGSITTNYNQQNAAQYQAMMQEARQQFEAQQPTGRQRDIERYTPNMTPDQRNQFGRDVLQKPQVQMQMGGSSGVWSDQQKIDANIPVENVVVDGKSGPKILVSGEAKGKSYDTLGRVETSLSSYKEMLKNTGTEIWPGQKKLAVGGLQKDLLLEMKELYNLGVLNGPDLEIMSEIMKDPTAISSQFYSGDDLIFQLETIIEPKIKAARERLDKQYGGSKVVPTVKPPEATSEGGWTVKRIK